MSAGAGELRTLGGNSLGHIARARSPVTVMAQIAPKPYRCVPCGETFPSMARASRHVDQKHSHGRIECVLDDPDGEPRRTAEATPAGTSPVGEGGGPVPTTSLAGEGGSSAEPASWHDLQRAAWIEGAIEKLTLTWPTELTAEQRLDFEEYFGLLEYEATWSLIGRAVELFEVFPSVAQLRRLQHRSRTSVAQEGLERARQALAGETL